MAQDTTQDTLGPAVTRPVRLGILRTFWNFLRDRLPGRKPLARPQMVPLAYTGKWIAWTPDGLRIVAAGDSPGEALDAAAAAGVPEAMCAWIPPKEELRSIPRPPGSDDR